MGAIGTYIGGSLAAAGHELVFIERTAGIEHPLRLEFKDQLIDLPAVTTINSVEKAMTGSPFDAAILAVKSFDTGAVLAEIEPFRHLFPPILCLQNGVENEAAVEEMLGSEKVIGGSVTSAIRRLGVGNAVVEKSRGVGIEEATDLSRELIRIFNQAGIYTRGYKNRASLKWSKMLTNLQANALPAILNWTPYRVLSTPATYAIECAAMREAVTVMKQMDIRQVNLPGTPVKPWVNAMTRWPLGISRPLIARLLGSGRGGKMPSLHIDLYAGKKQTEVVFLNGAVVRAAERLGLAAPVNQVLTQLLTGMVRGEISFEHFNDHPERIQQVMMEQI
jgi:2-dehydropantoate 2-reductase